MSGTSNVIVGDRGRLVLPADVREKYGYEQGTQLILVDSPRGLLLLTKKQLKDYVRADLQEVDLLAQLFADRRAAAEAETAA